MALVVVELETLVFEPDALSSHFNVLMFKYEKTVPVQFILASIFFMFVVIDSKD